MSQLDFDPRIDQYKVLGVDPKASPDEIKRVYRKLAKQYHPDSTGGDKVKESRFKEIGTAYEIIGDPKRRKQYDEIRAQLASNAYQGAPGSGRGRAGAGFGDFSGFEGFGGGPGGQMFDLNDLFGQLFAQQARAGGAQQARGSRAGGRMRVERMEPEPEVELESRIRASDGSWLRVLGADVHSEVRIPFDRAIQGTVVEVPTSDGKAQVKIPPGTSSGKQLRLRGKGVRGPTGDVGNHYVTVHIDVPGDLDDDAKRLLVELVQRVRKRSKKT